MDTEYVIMSLREEYYNDIISGKKRYEYRKMYRKGITKAYIYISKTKKAIKAIIEFDKPIIGSKETISSISENENKGSYNIMMEYLKKGTGYAIPIKSVTEIEEVSLDEMKNKFPNFTVPQSYYMLNNKKEILEYLQSKKILRTITFD